jgi:hypothetical protein
VEVHECAPGQFQVKVTCVDRADLHSDVFDGLSALPVSITSIDFNTVKHASSAAHYMHQGVGAGDFGVTEIHLQVCSLVANSQPQHTTTSAELRLHDGLKDMLLPPSSGTSGHITSSFCSISAEQVQMALYMSVCCSCPLIPLMMEENGGLGGCGQEEQNLWSHSDFMSRPLCQ